MDYTILAVVGVLLVAGGFVREHYYSIVRKRLERRLEALELSVDMLTRAVAESQPKPKRKYTRRIKQPAAEAATAEAAPAKLAPWDQPSDSRAV